MREHDFEIRTSFGAQELRVQAPPDGATESEGEETRLDQQESRAGLPAEMRASETYENVEVERRVIGRVRVSNPD